MHRLFPDLASGGWWDAIIVKPDEHHARIQEGQKYTISYWRVKHRGLSFLCAALFVMLLPSASAETGSTEVAGLQSQTTQGLIQNTVLTDNQYSVLLSIFVFAILIFIKFEGSTPFSFPRYRKIFSCFLISILLASAFSLPATLSTNYWNIAFAQEFNNQTLVGQQVADLVSAEIAFPTQNVTSYLIHKEIEIGKPVEWTQTVVLNETSGIEEMFIEIPFDAKNIGIDLVPDHSAGLIGASSFNDGYAQEAQQQTCTTGWYVTGYFTPLESDYNGKLVKIRADRVTLKVKKDFIREVKIEGWGKTTSGTYLGWYDRSFHLSDAPLDSVGNPLVIGSLATDSSVIPLYSQVTIPTLLSPWNEIIFTATDVGPSINGNHVDVYTGEGKDAENETYRITGYNNTVCVQTG